MVVLKIGNQDKDLRFIKYEKVCVISCPIATRSGYGARSRDFVKSLIDLKGQEWDIKILAQRWEQHLKCIDT